jgi:hypothetical protein
MLNADTKRAPAYGPKEGNVKLVEVELLKGYVPVHAEHDRDDVFLKLNPGERIRVPVDEANGLLEADIAKATRASFA